MKKHPYLNSYIRAVNVPRNRIELRDAYKLIGKFEDATVTDGIPRWKSNNSVPPQDILEFWEYMNLPFDFEKAELTREMETAKFLAEYRARNTGRQRTQEELYEMRAAFGPGAVIIDAITGDKISL